MERGDRDREDRTVRRESSLKYSQKKNEHEVMNYKPIEPIDGVDEIVEPGSGPELNDQDWPSLGLGGERGRVVRSRAPNH